MRKKKKKQTNSKKQLTLLIILIICGIVTTYQTTNSKEKATGTEQIETIVQNLPLNSDIYIKQTTAPATPEILLQRTGYLVSYNSNTRIANWVAWKLTPERLKENTERINNFRPDPDLPKSKAVTTQDYKGSGWDRGHLCPAGDNKWSRQAMIESFYMTNICPQHHNLNRGDWNELEQKCRKWVKKDSCLYIVAGPIFYDRKPQTIGEHKVAVPDAFFKVILSLHKRPKAIGFIYKNNEGNNPLDSYVNTVDEVERITGIDFFPALPDDIEKAVEASYNLKDWKDEGVMLDLKSDQVIWADGNAWAPCIEEKIVDGKYKYFFYFSGNPTAGGGKQIGVAVADSPTGPFKDLGHPILTESPVGHGQQIDVDVFTDPVSGKSYLYWGNGYMAGAELNEDMLSIKENTLTVLTPKGGSLKDYAFREAAYVFYRNGLYYFMWSVDDTGSPNYHVAYGTSKSPLGPIKVAKKPVVLIQDPAKEIYGPAHNAVLQIPGTDEWYIVYHRINKNFIDREKGPGVHREVCIDRMEFNPDGTIRKVVPTL